MDSRRAPSLADFSRATRRHKLAVCIPTFVLSVACAVALKTLPDIYESSASLMVAQAKNDAAVDPATHINEFRQYLTSKEVLETLAGKGASKDGPTDIAIAQMRDRISVVPDTSRYSQPGAFTISYRADDPETARGVTEELINRLIAQRSKGPASSSSGADALRDRAVAISAQLRELEERNPWLVGIRSDMPVSSQPARTYQPSVEALRAQQMSLETLKDQQYKFQQQLADVDGRIATQRQIVDQQKKGSSLRDNPTYAALISKRAELQGQRDTLINRQELTDKHPRVLGINDQISAINRQIDELRQQDVALVSQSPEARELASLESERNRLKIDLEVTGRELARRSANPPAQAAPREPVPVHSDLSSKLVQEYFGLKRSYKEVTTSLQDMESKLKPNDTAAQIQLRVLDPATMPQVPVSRNELPLISICGALGLILGVAVAFFADSGRRQTVQDAHDLECYARLPLLAEIPITTTEAERRRAWWRARSRFALAGILSIVATFALSRIFIASDIFSLITRK